MNWAPRFPRVLSALAVTLVLAPATLGAADPSPEGPSHAYVRPADVSCDQGAGTLTVVGQLFPVVSGSSDGEPELSLTLAAELEPEEETDEEATTDLELVVAPNPEPLPGISTDDMASAAERAGTLTASLSGSDGRLLTGDDPPTLAWEDWEPPLGFYEVRVATETFALPGFGDCTVNAATPVSSIQVGTEHELEEQRATGDDTSDLREYLPWIVLGVGVLGAVCLLVPAVLHLRRRAS